MRGRGCDDGPYGGFPGRPTRLTDVLPWREHGTALVVASSHLYVGVRASAAGAIPLSGRSARLGSSWRITHTRGDATRRVTFWWGCRIDPGSPPKRSRARRPGMQRKPGRDVPGCRACPLRLTSRGRRGILRVAARLLARRKPIPAGEGSPVSPAVGSAAGSAPPIPSPNAPPQPRFSPRPQRHPRLRLKDDRRIGRNRQRRTYVDVGGLIA